MATFNFEGDTVGAVPAGMTVRNGTAFTVAASTAWTGADGKFLRLVAPSGDAERFISFDHLNGQGDVDITCRMSFGAGTDGWQNQIFFRSVANPMTNSYLVGYETSGNGSVYLDRYVNGSWSRRATASATLPQVGPDSWWYLRGRANGNTFYAKAWLSGSPEPAGWNLEFADNSSVNGQYNGIGAWWGSKSYAFDSITADVVNIDIGTGSASLTVTHTQAVSVQTSFRVDGDFSYLPPALTVESLNSTTNSLSWTDEGADKYIIERNSFDGSQWNLDKVIELSALSLLDDIEEGWSYRYRIKSVRVLSDWVQPDPDPDPEVISASFTVTHNQYASVTSSFVEDSTGTPPDVSFTQGSWLRTITVASPDPEVVSVNLTVIHNHSVSLSGSHAAGDPPVVSFTSGSILRTIVIASEPVEPDPATFTHGVQVTPSNVGLSGAGYTTSNLSNESATSTTHNNQVIEFKNFTGRANDGTRYYSFIVNHDDVTIRYCRAVHSGTDSGISVRGNRCKIEYCDLDGVGHNQTIQDLNIGIYTSSSTSGHLFSRNYMINHRDGFHLNASSTDIVENYTLNKTNPGGHHDGVWNRGSSNNRVMRNNLNVQQTGACIGLYGGSGGVYVNYLVEDNYFRQGYNSSGDPVGTGINGVAVSSGSNITVRGNYWRHGTWFGTSWGINSSYFSWSDNWLTNSSGQPTSLLSPNSGGT